MACSGDRWLVLSHRLTVLWHETEINISAGLVAKLCNGDSCLGGF